MLKYRKAVYQTMAWNFGPMAAMAQDKMPFDAKEFALRAERVAFIAPLLKEAYGPETRDLPGSKLKPEMWNQRADFDHRLQVLLDRTSELARTAKTGDAAQSKSAFVARRTPARRVTSSIATTRTAPAPNQAPAAARPRASAR
jgi:cytochrome c556